MSATYFETVQRQVRQQSRRIEHAPARNHWVGEVDGLVRDPVETAIAHAHAATRLRAGRKARPGVGLILGAVVSLAMWLVIGGAVVSLVG